MNFFVLKYFEPLRIFDKIKSEVESCDIIIFGFNLIARISKGIDLLKILLNIITLFGIVFFYFFIKFYFKFFRIKCIIFSFILL